MEFDFSSWPALTLSLPWGAQSSCTESKSRREEITGCAVEEETAHGRGGVPLLEEWFFTRTMRPEPFPGYTTGSAFQRRLCWGCKDSLFLSFVTASL